MNMDKESNQKGKSNVSPTLLTPCRPVGLRRKHSIVKITSPSVNLSSVADITSPSTPATTSTLKPRIISNESAPVENVQEHFGKSGAKSYLKNVQSEEVKDLKRKSTSPSCRSVLRRKLTPRNSNNSSAKPSNSSRKESSFIADEEVASVKNEENYKTSSEVPKDSETISSETDRCHSHSAKVSEESLANRVITAIEINALKERIARKEKQLKEQELAALYKKKHNPEQVTKEIDSWLQGCKEALSDLQSELAKRGQNYSLVQLLNKLGIPPSLVDVDDESE